MRSPVAGRDAFEAQLAPPDRGLVVAVSHEGETHATLETARRRPPAPDATVAVVTVRPDRVPPGLDPIGDTAPGPLVVPHDRLRVAAAHRRPRRRLPHGRRERTGHRRGDGRPGGATGRRGAALAGCSRLLAVGSAYGVELTRASARRAALPTTPLGVEKVLHGHLPAAEAATTGVVLLRFDPSQAGARDDRAGSVAEAAAVLGLPVVTIRPRVPASSAAEALLAGGLALQLLTLELTHVLGTNPDLIRREQEPYRRAAEAAGAG